MSTERFIHGKHDDGKHDGLYSNRKREQAAQYHLEHWNELIDATVSRKERGRIVNPLAERPSQVRYLGVAQEDITESSNG